LKSVVTPYGWRRFSFYVFDGKWGQRDRDIKRSAICFADDGILDAHVMMKQVKVLP
jgi:hypothetical protein